MHHGGLGVHHGGLGVHHGWLGVHHGGLGALGGGRGVDVGGGGGGGRIDAADVAGPVAVLGHGVVLQAQGTVHAEADL